MEAYVMATILALKSKELEFQMATWMDLKRGQSKKKNTRYNIIPILMKIRKNS